MINRGENGRSIPRLDWEIEAAVQTICSIETDVLTVMLGSNDLLQCPDLSAEVCGERMEQFLAALLEKAQADIKILLVAPPLEPGALVSNHRTLEKSRRLARCYETVAQRLGIAFADAGVWGEGITYDGVHFSEEGHLAFAKGIRAVLNALL